MKLTPTKRVLFSGLFFFTLKAAAAGAAAAGQAEALAVDSGNLGWGLVRMMGALAIVFAVFFGGVWLLKNSQRFMAKRGLTAKLQVIEAKSLGPRQTIYVIGYEKERLLIASSPAGVNFLSSLPAAENEPAVAAQLPRLLISCARRSIHDETSAPELNEKWWGSAAASPWLKPQRLVIQGSFSPDTRFPGLPGNRNRSAQTNSGGSFNVPGGFAPFRLNVRVEAAQQPQDVDIAIKILFTITLQSKKRWPIKRKGAKTPRHRADVPPKSAPSPELECADVSGPGDGRAPVFRGKGLTGAGC